MHPKEHYFQRCAGRASQPDKKSPGDITGANATSLKTISKPTRAGQLDACAQRQSDGLADSLARTKTAPAKKKGPGNLGGGTRGRRTAMGGSDRPHLDYARSAGSSKRVAGQTSQPI